MNSAENSLCAPAFFGSTTSARSRPLPHNHPRRPLLQICHPMLVTEPSVLHTTVEDGVSATPTGQSEPLNCLVPMVRKSNSLSVSNSGQCPTTVADDTEIVHCSLFKGLPRPTHMPSLLTKHGPLSTINAGVAAAKCALSTRSREQGTREPDRSDSVVLAVAVVIMHLMSKMRSWAFAIIFTLTMARSVGSGQRRIHATGKSAPSCCSWAQPVANFAFCTEPNCVPHAISTRPGPEFSCSCATPLQQFTNDVPASSAVK